MNLSKSQYQRLQVKGAELFKDLKHEVELGQGKWVIEFVVMMQAYFRKIINMQEAGLKDEIAYISLSLLRTKMLSGEYQIRLDAYHQGWYLDRIECSGIYEVGHFYGRLDEFMKLLVKMRQETFVNLTFGEINEHFFRESQYYFFTVSEFIRTALKEAVKTEEFQKIKRAPVFCIHFGEFQDSLAIVYKEDHTTLPMSSEEVEV